MAESGALLGREQAAGQRERLHVERQCLRRLSGSANQFRPKSCGLLRSGWLEVPGGCLPYWWRRTCPQMDWLILRTVARALGFQMSPKRFIRSMYLHRDSSSVGCMTPILGFMWSSRKWKPSMLWTWPPSTLTARLSWQSQSIHRGQGRIDLNKLSPEPETLVSFTHQNYKDLREE